jgi:hypothetical protein
VGTVVQVKTRRLISGNGALKRKQEQAVGRRTEMPYPGKALM